MKCTRCNQNKEPTFVLLRRPNPGFARAAPEDLTVPADPTHVETCTDCMTDLELSELVAPVAIFVLTALLTPAGDPAGPAAHSIAHAKAYMEIRQPNPPGPSYRKESLRALMGLMGKVRVNPTVDVEQITKALVSRVARNMYLAAHPDEMELLTPEGVEKLGQRVAEWMASERVVEFAVTDTMRHCVTTIVAEFRQMP